MNQLVWHHKREVLFSSFRTFTKIYFSMVTTSMKTQELIKPPYCVKIMSLPYSLSKSIFRNIKNIY